jgi:hypothetical protein
MYMSKLEKNLVRIHHDPQAAQDFENVMAAFVQKYGEPDEEDLEALTDIVLNEQKWWYNPLRAVLVLVVIGLLIAGAMRCVSENFI